MAKKKINVIYISKWQINITEYSYLNGKILSRSIFHKKDFDKPLLEGNFQKWAINTDIITHNLAHIKKSEFDTKENYLILPAEFFYQFFYKIDKIYSLDDYDYIYWRIKNNIPKELSNKIELDFQFINKERVSGEQVFNFFVSSLNKKFLKEISKLFFDIDIKIDAISNDSVEFLNFFDSIPLNSGIIIVEDGYTSFFYKDGGIFNYYRNFEIGLHKIKNKILNFYKTEDFNEAFTKFENSFSKENDEFIDLESVNILLGDWTENLIKIMDSLRKEFNCNDKTLELILICNKFSSNTVNKFIENICDIKIIEFPKEIYEKFDSVDNIKISDSFALSEFQEIENED